MGRPHFVLLQNPDGSVGKFRMKQWLREHPDELPPGMDATDNTAHQLRGGLAKRGWRLEILPDEVHVIRPDRTGGTAYAEQTDYATSEPSQDVLEEEEAEEITFGLERDLQNALRGNIEQLEVGLRIADHGRERTVEAGRIDITAVDNRDTRVIIELKAGLAGPSVVAQTLAYMGSVAAEDGRPVRGIIVAGDFHKKVILASRATPNLQLRKYSIQFKFENC